MHSTHLKLILLLSTWSLLLGGCKTYSPTSYPADTKKTQPGKIRYVESENMNWTNSKEQNQELADEI